MVREDWKVGDEVFWNRNIILTEDDWESCGLLKNYEQYLEEELKKKGKLILKEVDVDDVYINFYYPRKLFTKITNYELW